VATVVQHDSRVDKALMIVVVALWSNKSTTTILMNRRHEAAPAVA